jgi:MFS family permease
MLIAGRFINGFSVGICSAQVPVYVSELAPPHRRGLVVGTQQWAITWGILIMFYISYACSYIDGAAAFRIPWALQMTPAILLFFALFFLPESPRWLAQQDRWEEAIDILALVHANGDRQDRGVRTVIEQLQSTCSTDHDASTSSYWELFSPNMIWRTHICIFVQIWSQLSGINVIMYCELLFFFNASTKLIPKAD